MADSGSDGLRAESDGVTLFGGFEGASLAAVRAAGSNSFDVDCLQEPDVPELAFNRVFFDYSFACGIRNESVKAREVTVYLNLCERSAARNARFMCGPWWVKRGETWNKLSESAHASGEGWVDARVVVQGQETVLLSSKPFWTADETRRVLTDCEERLPFAHKRSIGTTAEGRDIWAIETERREQAIVISSSMQSAEFAGDVCLHVLDWLGTRTHPTVEWLQRYQFCLVPETMPDGVAHGYSIMNAGGRCPMFDSGAAFAGTAPCAEESAALMGLLVEKKPAVWVDLHVHPGAYNSPKLNPVKPEIYSTADLGERAARADRAVAGLFAGERNIPLPLDDPDFSMRDSTPVLAAEHFGTVSLCFQNYALTEEGRKAFMVIFMETVLRAIEGPGRNTTCPR